MLGISVLFQRVSRKLTRLGSLVRVEFEKSLT